MTNPTFSEFESYSREDWEKLVAKELRGKDISSIDFVAGSFSTSPIAFTSEGSGGYRGAKALTGSEGNAWKVRQDFLAGETELVFTAIQSGVQLVGLNTGDYKTEELKSIGTELTAHSALLVVLDEDIHQAVDRLASSGLNSDLVFEFESNSVKSVEWRNRGASIEHEITWALCQGHSILFELLESGKTIDEASALISFKLGVGEEYYMEMCKIKTLRKLWAVIVQSYSPEHNCSVNTRITAETIIWNKPNIDVNTNLIRLTTEAMSAIIGGCDALIVNTHDGSRSDKSLRLARNIQHLLRHEGWLAEVSDPMEGSYFLDMLTIKLADVVWEKFKELDPHFAVFKSSGEMNDLIDADAKMQRDRLGKERVVIGVTDFLNPKPVNGKFNEPRLTEILENTTV